MPETIVDIFGPVPNKLHLRRKGGLSRDGHRYSKVASATTVVSSQAIDSSAPSAVVWVLVQLGRRLLEALGGFHSVSPVIMKPTLL